MGKLVRMIYRSCIDKRSVSLEVANKIVDKKAKLNIVVYFYKCIFCNSYHITKRSPLDKIIELEVL